MPHASTLRRCADLAGRAPLRQISNHAAAHNLIAVQEPLLGAAPDNLRHPPGLLGLIHSARTPVAGNFTTHHRRATPNRAADTHLGQASLHPHHNRSAILNTEHPTTAHNHPLQQHCYHTNSLHPMTLPTMNDTMSKIDGFITNEKRTAPQLTLKEINKYGFQIVNDSGTGSGYRGLITFNIALFENSDLPVISHDSFMITNIEIATV